MPPAKDLLRPGYQQQTTVDRTTADGFYAETTADGSLQHFGFYRQGEAIGWTLEVEDGRAYATRTITRECVDADELSDMVNTIYRDADAEHCVCLFCGKTSAEVATLIAGPERHTYICDECIRTCATILDSQKS